MKLIKFALPLMLVTFSASAESVDPNCRVYSPADNQGSVDADGAWVPAAASSES